MSYTFDSWWSPNTNGQGYPKSGFCIHHAATTNFYNIGATFQNTYTQTSAHYGVEPGHVCQYLSDDSNAWACGNTWANNNLISIECLNSGGDAEGWPVSEDTINTLIEFLADKCMEYGWSYLAVGDNLFGHKDFYNTFCPGVLYDRLEEIANRVNARLNGEDDDMTTPDDIWNFNQNGTLMRDRIQGTDEAANVARENSAKALDILTRRDDVSGRGTDADLYERICWLGARTADLEQKLDSVATLLNELADKLAKDE